MNLRVFFQLKLCILSRLKYNTVAKRMSPAAVPTFFQYVKIIMVFDPEFWNSFHNAFLCLAYFMYCHEFVLRCLSLYLNMPAGIKPLP